MKDKNPEIYEFYLKKDFIGDTSKIAFTLPHPEVENYDIHFLVNTKIPPELEKRAKEIIHQLNKVWVIKKRK